jgi:hypothetical protein
MLAANRVMHTQSESRCRMIKMVDVDAMGRFAQSLTEACLPTEHEKWFVIMSFGLGILKESPEFLMHLIVMRAEVECQLNQPSGERFPTLGEMVVKFIDELGLELQEKKST